MTKVSPKNTATARQAEASHQLDLAALRRHADAVDAVSLILIQLGEGNSGLDPIPLKWLGLRLGEVANEMLTEVFNAQQGEG